MTIRELYQQMDADYDDLLTRLPKEELVGRFLQKYIDSSDFEKMIKAYVDEDYEKVFETSHNLKGMSANLSLIKTQKTISEICEAVRNGPPQTDISDLIEQAKQDHALLLTLMDQL